MKKYFLFTILAYVLASVSANAQDVIVKTANSTILSKVEEITSESIKYRKWSNLDGPIYVINISEVISINYSNGTVDTFVNKPQQVAEVEYVTTPQKSSVENVRVKSENNIDFLRRDDLLKSARGYRVGGIICAVSGGALMVAGIVGGVLGDSMGFLIAAECVGGAAVVVGGCLTGIGKKRQWEAYAIEKADFMEIKLGDTNAYASLCSTYNPLLNHSNIGVGIALRF